MIKVNAVCLKIMAKSKLIPLVFLLFAFAFHPFTPRSSRILGTDGRSTDPTRYSDEWRPTGPHGGDVRSLVVDPNNADHFYFGTLDGQIYTSTDGGKHWQLLYNFNRPRLFIDHIIVDPRDSRMLYVAAHRHKEPGGFFKSTDGGVTWRDAPALREEALHSMTQSSRDP